jgi:hypothetical protein
MSHAENERSQFVCRMSVKIKSIADMTGRMANLGARRLLAEARLFSQRHIQ